MVETLVLFTAWRRFDVGVVIALKWTICGDGVRVFMICVLILTVEIPEGLRFLLPLLEDLNNVPDGKRIMLFVDSRIIVHLALFIEAFPKIKQTLYYLILFSSGKLKLWCSLHLGYLLFQLGEQGIWCLQLSLGPKTHIFDLLLRPILELDSAQLLLLPIILSLNQ